MCLLSKVFWSTFSYVLTARPKQRVESFHTMEGNEPKKDQ